MGSTGASVLKILRNASSYFELLRLRRFDFERDAMSGGRCRAANDQEIQLLVLFDHVGFNGEFAGRRQGGP
jgi:hypothetical protein